MPIERNFKFDTRIRKIESKVFQEQLRHYKIMEEVLTDAKAWIFKIFYVGSGNNGKTKDEWWKGNFCSHRRPTLHFLSVPTGSIRSQTFWSKFDGLFTLQMNKEKIQTTPGVSIFFLIFIFDRLFQPIIDWSYKDSHKLIRKMEVTCPLF